MEKLDIESGNERLSAYNTSMIPGCFLSDFLVKN